MENLQELKSKAYDLIHEIELSQARISELKTQLLETNTAIEKAREAISPTTGPDEGKTKTPNKKA